MSNGITRGPRVGDIRDGNVWLCGHARFMATLSSLTIADLRDLQTDGYLRPHVVEFEITDRNRRCPACRHAERRLRNLGMAVVIVAVVLFGVRCSLG